MTAVFRHELRGNFHSLTTYLFGACLLAFIGLWAMMYNLQAAVSNFEFVLADSCLAFVVIVPVLTMRTIAEERRQKTDQLLYALPITTVQVVLGKYLALLAVYAVPLCVIAAYPLIFSRYGEVYLPTSYGSLFAFFLLGALIQYVTRNEKLAWGVGAVLLVLTMAAYWLEPAAFEGLLPRIMTQLSLFERFYVFVNGVFDWTAVVYYASVIGFFLFLTVQSLEKRRYN